MLIWIVTKHYTVGIEVTDDNNRIAYAPPICRWVIGKDVNWFRNYLAERRQLIEWVEVETCEKQKQN